MDTDERPSLEAVYRGVADERRRHVLTYLHDTDSDTSSLDDLVTYVVRQESNSPTPDRESVTIDLYHVHLPLLADTGFIEFDSHTETVRYDGHEDVETVLDSLSRRSCGIR